MMMSVHVAPLTRMPSVVTFSVPSVFTLKRVSYLTICSLPEKVAEAVPSLSVVYVTLPALICVSGA